ncbi:MAG: autotransporter-associated beta strand repeat-containing protein [Chthoniobacterales bacterium]
MKKTLFIFTLFALVAGNSAHAEFLYNSYLYPSFYGAPNSEYSAWDVFYTPYNNPNYPDISAPFGTKTIASAAGFTPPSNSSPVDPAAYWNLNNPTITQTGTNTAFIVGPGTAGNIYSLAAPTSFNLQDTLPYTGGTVLFQFQTEGTPVDFSSIKLKYTDGGGTHFLDPTDMLREYRSSSSTFGGLNNRTAVEWDLSGLNITSYQIVWNAASASMSFQQAVLDTYVNYTAVIPESRTWASAGGGNWSDAGAWDGQSYTAANANGNIKFINAAPATITLDSAQIVGQITFNTAADTTLNSTGGAVLSANTGIVTTGSATGTYTFNSNYAFGAYNVFDLAAGKVVMNGVVSGNYGMLKNGDGELVLNNDNSFQGAVAVQGGTLRLNGSNSYAGSTTVLMGELIVGNNGALGVATSNITLGADSDIFVTVGGGPSAIFIDGDHTIGRNISLANGTFQKTLGAMNTTVGAVFSGNVDLGSSDNVKLTATAASDIVNFSGAITGGSGLNVAVNGAGTVIFSGANKSYSSNTSVSNGKLWIQAGTAYTGNGNVTVNGGKLQVDGSIDGTGTVSLFQATVSGAGSINRNVITNGSTSVIESGMDALTITSLNAANGARFEFDLAALSAPLAISNLFTGSTAAGGLQVDFLNTSGTEADTVYTLISFGSMIGLSASDFAMLNGPDWALDTSYGIGGWNIHDGLVQVKFTAVPEPSTVAELLAGFLLLAFLGRRKLRARA